MTTSRGKSRARRRRWLQAGLLTLWAALMTPLLFWGLPDRSRDHLLFAGEPAWPAERYGASAALEQLQTQPVGADTDLNPVVTPDRIVDLTPDGPARAEILRRYRLYSRQPDEMIVFRALQRMRPREFDFDPRLYQYGGAYLYLVAATLAVGHTFGLTPLSGDVSNYLAQPELFGRFYVAARLLSLFFGGLTLVAVYRLAAQAAGRRAGYVAAVLLAGTGVFLTAITEAKPHLPAACMLLWATLSAIRYRRTARLRDLARTAVQAGFAFGLVLTGILGALLLPAATCGRRHWATRAALAGALLIGVYVLTNPYVPYNWLTGRAALTSNLDNSLAMYRGQIARAGDGLVRVVHLLVESAGWVVPAAGLVGGALALRRYPGPTLVGGACAVATLVMAALLGADKPAEYARFLILPVAVLAIGTAVLLGGWLRRRRALGFLAAFLVLTTLPYPVYARSLRRDAGEVRESRRLAAEFLVAHMRADDAVGVLQEPAPYSVPPLDFNRRRVFLLPRAAPPEPHEPLPEWLVFATDQYAEQPGAWWRKHYTLVTSFPSADELPSPITWANKPICIYRLARQ